MKASQASRCAASELNSCSSPSSEDLRVYIAQRWRLTSARAIATHRRRADWTRQLRGQAGGGSIRLQPEEERSRPGRAGDLSRQRGERAVARALPGEAVIEHQHVIGSTLPFTDQPGSGLQFGVTRSVSCPGLLELLCHLAKLAQPANGDFLHPVCDGSQQQLAAEVSGRLSFIE